MSIRDALAVAHGRSDERLNVALGKQLAKAEDAEGVAELVALLDDRVAAADAIKALYECGADAPGLLVPHVARLAQAAASKNGRLVWGALTALAAVAQQAPDAVWPVRQVLERGLDNGSVISRDRAVGALVALARSSPLRAKAVAPLLTGALDAAQPKDLARLAGHVLPVLPALARTNTNKALSSRLGLLVPSARRKLEALLDP